MILRPHPGMLCGEAEIFLRLDGELHTLRGRHVRDLVANILTLVDGRSTQDEIVAGACRQGASREWAARAVQWLVEEGLCVRDRSGDAGRPLLSAFEPQIRYFALHASMPTDVQSRLGDSRVNVIGHGPLGSLLVQHLAQSGIGHVRGIGASALAPPEALLLGSPTRDDRHQALSRWIATQGLATRYHGVAVEADAAMDWDSAVQGCDLAVVVAAPMAIHALSAFNRAALHASVTFLSIILDAPVAAVGPLVIPEETACLTCRELRRPRRDADEAFRHLQEARADTLALGVPDDAFLFSHLAAVAALAVAEMVVALSGCREPSTLGRELLVDPHTWRIQAVPVLKVPRCWDCGRTRRVPPARPFALADVHGDRQPPAA